MDKDNPPAASAASQAPTPAPAQPDNSIRVEGILDLDNSRNGQLLDLSKHGKRRPTDPFVPRELVRRFHLQQGSIITALATPDERFPNPKVRFIEKVDGMDFEARRRAIDFANLTTITPNEQLKLELKDGRMTNRVIDLFCPLGKGTRGLIVAPPRTGKTTFLRDIALGVLQNHPECHVMILLVDERPEEVTDFKRTVPCEVWASSNDDPVENHLRVADLCIERAKRLVECGKDVLILLDSITRLARAHNNVRNTGRTGS
ncbi:MAG: transcription termination factor Rho, partial [Opitutae bacterium]|nr:transcription termination factor Rho [Opitutae bacterium]